MDADFEKELIAAATDTERLLTAEFARLSAEAIKGSSLDQAGLRNGLEIIEEYIRHGEPGLAFDHLLYMIEETGVPVSARTEKFVREHRPNARP